MLNRHKLVKATLLLGLAGLQGCGREQPSVAEAEAYVEQAERELAQMSAYVQRAAWVNESFITEDSDWLAAKAGGEATALSVKLANGAKRFSGIAMPEELARKLNILKTGIVMPAPETPGMAEELAGLATTLTSTYGKGTGTLRGEALPGVEIEARMGTERDPAALLEMWRSWHDVAKPMRADYQRIVEIANQGARELGYADTGALWRSNYDMDPDAFAAMVDRLWGQVEPLYQELHCHVRAKLGEQYGKDVVKPGAPIPAHLLGNMWAQQWGNLYDLVEPEGSKAGYDLSQLLQQANYTPERMVKTGEGFFTSLGLAPLPETFWQRSMITKPRDREVICHASAWDLDNKDDIRIKMCTMVNGEDFETIHHELGHNFYQRAYQDQNYLHLNGANDGFHEAIGDLIGLSITPEYLAQIGLLPADKLPDASADLGLLMQRALDKVAFLPFGLLVDKWRWQVFSGQLTPDQYNQGWWDLRRHYQGIEPAVARDADAFDPGAKYHIPANVPYMRYFLSFILQFQFHQAACAEAGWQGPLHRCSIYGNQQVGEKFKQMLAMGASKPWPDALEAFTGSREIDGGALIAYFQPLMDWLKEQNQGRTCGWE